MTEDYVVCWQFNPQRVLMHAMVYFMIRLITNKYPKNHQIASNIISSYSCVAYVLTDDLEQLISYYWYDLVIMLCNRDYIMIAHHLFTIYGISHCTWYLDYEKVFIMLKTMKLSDVLVHHHKIVDALELEKKYFTLATVYKIFTVFVTCVLWVLLRVIHTATLFPFEVLKTNILIPIFLLVNVAWVIKLLFLVKRLLIQLSYRDRIAAKNQ